MLMFFYMKKQIGDKMVNLGEDTARYIDIHFNQVEVDCNKFPDPESRVLTRYEAKICTQDDFGYSE